VLRELTDPLALLLLPPAGPLLLLALGAILARRRIRLGVTLGVLGFATLWLSSLEGIGYSLLRRLEPPPVSKAALANATAIVVLGALRIHDSPEYGEDTAGTQALARLRYAARLARTTGLPILVSGGKPYGGALPEGEVMARVLQQDFNTPVKWIEDRSTTTAENAAQSFALLQPAGHTRIALVTSAWHMPRAERTFRKAGFDVIPAPTAYTSRRESRLTDWLPSAEGLYATHVALWELLGAAWYRLRGAIA
jgi:uncharacterized SAM-binding protein YcdF (DUF218 family)